MQVLPIVSFTLLFASEPQPPKLDLEIEDAECSKFAKSFQKAVNKREAKKVEELIAWETMIDVAIDGIEVHKRAKQNFKEDYQRDAIGIRSSFVASLMSASPRFEFLHLRRANGKPHLLFRTRRGEEVDYLELLIFRSGSGAVQAFDAFSFFIGENNTDWLRRIFLLSSPNARIQGRHPLFGSTDKEIKERKALIERMSAASLRQDGKEVLRLADSLPAELQKELWVRRLRINAASTLRPDEFAAEIGRFRDAFPDHPANELFAIDFEFKRRNYDAFLRAIDRLDRRVNDAYLLELSSGVMLLVGRPETALAEADKAIARGRTNLDVRGTRVQALALLKRYADAAKELRTLEKEQNDTFELLNPNMKPFIESPEYRAMREKK